MSENEVSNNLNTVLNIHYVTQMQNNNFKALQQIWIVGSSLISFYLLVFS